MKTILTASHRGGWPASPGPPGRTVTERISLIIHKERSSSPHWCESAAFTTPNALVARSTDSAPFCYLGNHLTEPVSPKDPESGGSFRGVVRDPWQSSRDLCRDPEESVF